MAAINAGVDDILKMLEEDRKEPTGKTKSPTLKIPSNKKSSTEQNVIDKWLHSMNKTAVYEDEKGENDESLEQDLKSFIGRLDDIKWVFMYIFSPHQYDKNVLILTRPKFVALEKYFENEEHYSESNLSVYIKKPKDLNFVKPQLLKLVESTRSSQKLQTMTPCKFISYLEDKLHYQIVYNDDKRSVTSYIIQMFNKIPELKSYTYRRTERKWNDIKDMVRNVLLSKGLTINAVNVSDIIDDIEETIGESVLRYKDRMRNV